MSGLRSRVRAKEAKMQEVQSRMVFQAIRPTSRGVPEVQITILESRETKKNKKSVVREI